MVPQLDPNIIYGFRSKVHEHNEFIRLFFEDYKTNKIIEGKDIWSKICSCMDWLTVSIEGIEKPEKNSNMNITSLKFTQFLVTIDMIVEGVNHLWLAIGQPNNVKQPYIKDRSIFNGREFDRDYTDEKYFKEIRSWFGVHAVNGNEVYLNGFSKGVRFFSSWSNSSFLNEEEFYIRLYSNDKRAEEKYGGFKRVKINDLIQFVSLRYNTLTKLMKEIEHLYDKEKKKLQNTPVIYDPHGSELKQLQDLYKQSKERKLTEEHYEYDIQQYISFLSCDLNDFIEADKQLVKEYLLELKPIIPVYNKIIQEVDDSEYEVFKILDMRSEIYKENFYDFSKVLEYASGGSNISIGIFCLKSLIKKGLLPDYCLDLSKPCLYLLIHAIDYKIRKVENVFE